MLRQIIESGVTLHFAHLFFFFVLFFEGRWETGTLIISILFPEAKHLIPFFFPLSFTLAVFPLTHWVVT